MRLNYPQYDNGMFILNKSDFDNIASMILKEYLPDVINKPCVVDINYIVKECLYLNIYSKNITADKSVLGLIAFENALLPCFDLAYNKIDMKLQAGDIVIDLSLSGKWMKFRRRFTLAHEASHWILHRSYHSPTNQPYEFRKPYEETFASNIEKKYITLFSDTDREEWQANSLAAALLMPKGAFLEAAFSYKEIEVDDEGKIIFDDLQEYINYLHFLSSIFEVSRQAAEIRLEQLGVIHMQ